MGAASTRPYAFLQLKPVISPLLLVLASQMLPVGQHLACLPVAVLQHTGSVAGQQMLLQVTPAVQMHAPLTGSQVWPLGQVLSVPPVHTPF